MICADVMTKDPSCCVPTDSCSRVAKIMKIENVGSIPVCENRRSRRLIGIATDRDLALHVAAESRDADATVVEEVMTKDPITCFSLGQPGQGHPPNAESSSPQNSGDRPPWQPDWNHFSGRHRNSVREAGEDRRNCGRNLKTKSGISKTGLWPVPTSTPVEHDTLARNSGHILAEFDYDQAERPVVKL